MSFSLGVKLKVKWFQSPLSGYVQRVGFYAFLNLNRRKQLSVDDRNEWEDVRIVIIDEVSFMSDTILKTLDMKLKEIKDRTKPFGGFTIIFAGDFRQLEPVGAKETDLLFSSLSSQHWENCINAVIILDNEHRFKEDPEYGQMLKRMWSGDLTKDDRMRINSRVLGTNGLQLPPDIERDLYMKLPAGFTLSDRTITDQDRKDYVLKLEKNLLHLCLENDKVFLLGARQIGKSWIVALLACLFQRLWHAVSMGRRRRRVVDPRS